MPSHGIIAAAVMAFATSSIADSTSSYPDGTEQGFSLVARVTRSQPDSQINVEGYKVASLHTGAGTDSLILISPTNPVYGLNPSVFYSNGTSAQQISYTGSVIRSYPTAEYPSGIVIGDAGTESSQHSVEVDLGTSTNNVALYGVSQTASEGSQPFLGYTSAPGSGNGAGQFYTCYHQYEDVLLSFLYFADVVGSTPASTSCEQIKLLPQCEGDVANATDYTQKSYCYTDAADASLV